MQWKLTVMHEVKKMLKAEGKKKNLKKILQLIIIHQKKGTLLQVNFFNFHKLNFA